MLYNWYDLLCLGGLLNMSEIRSTRVEVVGRKLAERILDGEFPVGSWLPAERRLSEEMGVSRTVMREAMRHLQSEGLIRIQHGKGVLVVNEAHGSFGKAINRIIPDDVSRLRQLVEARLIVEPEVAALAALRAENVNVRELERIQALFAGVGDADEGVELDMAFHSEIARAAGNSIILMMLDACAQVSRKSRLLTLSAYPVSTAIDHHQGILEAIAEGKNKLARSRMKRHIMHASSDLDEIIKQLEE